MDVDSLMRGKFTLKDMYQQMEAMNKLGPLKQIMQMLPMGGLGIELSDKEYQMTKDRLDKYRVVMDSMTTAELEDPKVITASRIKRISRGSGASPDLVRELLKSHQAMQKAIKGMRGGMGKMNMKRIMKRVQPGNQDVIDVSRCKEHRHIIAYFRHQSGCFRSPLSCQPILLRSPPSGRVSVKSPITVLPSLARSNL